MSDLKDFVIENGVLKKYVGAGGDVVIPDGVTQIGNEAFYLCRNLDSIAIPDSVINIGKRAFCGTNLKTVALPSGIKCIKEMTFSDCENLESVFIPNSITTIEYAAFWGCLSLTDVSLPVEVSAIEKCAFRDCKSLAKITFASNSTNIGPEVFIGCDSLADSDGFIIVKDVLYGYIGANSCITVPDHIVSISDSAFKDCENLINICLPDSLMSIGVAAFSNCSKLECINLPIGISNIGDRAFEFCKKLNKITIPHQLTKIGEWTFRGCSSLNTITIPKNITAIGPRAFEYCKDLTTIIFEGNVDKIGVNVFNGCSIKSVLAPNIAIDILKKHQLMLAATLGFFAQRAIFTDECVIKEYGKYAISQKKSLLPMIFESDLVESLSFYANAGKVNVNTFEHEFFKPAQAAKASQCIAFLVNWKNENISQEAIENNLEKQIDKDPFNVTDMKKLWSYKKLKDGTLSITGYKGNAVNITIPERIGKDIVTEIDDEAFSAIKDHRPKATKLVMKNIQSIIIPETIKNIGMEAFGYCTSLTDIIMPDSITKIGDYAFRYCKSLTNVTLPAKIRKIGVAAFEECHNLNEITVPNMVKKIGERAFWRCNNLTNVNISDSVSTIDIGAFGACPVTIHTPAGSYAEQYAKENNIPFVAE